MTMKTHQTPNKLYIAQTRQLFHCHCKIKIPLSFGEALLDDCFALMEEIDRRYNSYRPGSFFDRINRQAGRWVEVDEITLDLLQELIRVSTLTDGAYDITSMPLIRLWGFYDDNPLSLPPEKSIREAIGRVNYRAVEIRGNRVRIANGQEIITGSFIKAFAVDEVVKKLVSEGVADAIINAGGSTIYGLNDGTHPEWKVNIPHPFRKGERVEQRSLSNRCFNLSGRAHNYITIGDRQYGHILNAKTGWPSETVQVGVFTDRAFLGDVLSTALFTVEPDELPHTVEQLKQHYMFDFFRVETPYTTSVISQK